MYGNGNASATPGSAATAPMYATSASTAPSAGHHGGNQPSQGMSASYNSYGGGNQAGAGQTASGIFYSSSPAGAPAGQPMYSTNPMFQVGGQSSSLAQGAQAGSQMLSPQQQANAAAAAAAYANAAANINVGSKLFVGQVPAVCTEEQLRPLFGQFGRLLEIKIMREPNGRSRGSAWVRYESEDSARRAIAALNEKHVVPPQTNPLRVQFAAPSPNRAMQQQQQAQMQQQQQQLPSSGAISAIITSSPSQQQQQNYATSTYATAPQGYAPQATATAAYLPQGQYASSNVISYGNSESAFAMRTSPQGQPQQQQAGKVEYVRSSQPAGGMLYSTSAPAGAMQQRQASQPQQQQVVYTTGGQMRTGVVYTPEGFAMANQQQQQQQQQQQWRS